MHHAGQCRHFVFRYGPPGGCCMCVMHVLKSAPLRGGSPGSQLPLLMPRSDARQNLIDSLTVATAYFSPPHAALLEVAVCFGGRLMRGNRCQKVPLFTSPELRIIPNNVVDMRPPDAGQPLPGSAHLGQMSGLTTLSMQAPSRWKDDLVHCHELCTAAC